jgi:hypothetical protein
MTETTKAPRPCTLELFNGQGASVLVPVGRKRGAANDSKIVAPRTGALDTWWRVDDLRRRASAQLTPKVNVTRRRVTWEGVGRLPIDEARALGRLKTYRWHEGDDHWSSVARLIVSDQAFVAVTLVDDLRLLRLPDGEKVKPHMDALLAWMVSTFDRQ